MTRAALARVLPTAALAAVAWALAWVETGSTVSFSGRVSWSTGPNGSAGCGGFTGVTPLTLYRDWILQTARQWGMGL